MILNNENASIFFKYIAERHLIYKKRFLLNQSKPWTNDVILQRFRFTNVFRELDTGTQYVINNILPFCKDLKQVIFNLFVYRLYNKIETFDAVGLQDVNKFNAEFFESKLRGLKSAGVPVFTGAFIVSGYSWVNPNADKISNSVKLIKWFCDIIESIANKISSAKNSEVTYDSILSIKGVGKFLSYQISVDLGYWDNSLFNESSFVVAGPGCVRGLDFIFSSRSGSYEDCIKYLCDIQLDWFVKLGINVDDLFSDRFERKLNLMSMENCLCEISKYLKVYYKIGRPRNLLK